MEGTILVGVIALVAVVVVGVLCTRAAPSWTAPRWAGRVWGRAHPVAVVLVEQLGRGGAAFSAFVAGGGFMVLTLWLLGEAAQAVEPVVDHPVFRWFAQGRNASWDRVWLVLTNVGSLDVTQWFTVVATLVLTSLWWQRRWWVPLLVLPAGYLLEKNIQELLKLVVDRGHPPTTLGTYPSGGCARVLVVYGLVAFLLLRWSGTRDSRWWVGAAAVVLLLETVQAYARMYNQEHWLTDVLGGAVFGLLLLTTMVTVTTLLDWGGTTRRPPALDDARRAPALESRTGA